MLFINSIFIFVIGLLIGSFLGAFSYRWPKNISIAKGRSFCPRCKKTISWYDNIPVFSYLILRGKCRHCNKKISSRYFLIELFTGLSFLTAYIFRNTINQNINWLEGFGLIGNFVFMFLIAIMVFVFIVDSEYQIIPDFAVFWGLLAILISFVVTDYRLIFEHLLAGFSASIFLLFINVITKGQGMGLGDVKFAVLAGTILGPANTLVWIFLSFIVGGIFGIAIVILNKANLKDKIAFGPFLILAFGLTALFGSNLVNLIGWM